MCITACLVPEGARGNIGSPGPGVTNGYDSSCGSWELKQGSLQEEQVLTTAESPFKPQSETVISDR